MRGNHLWKTSAVATIGMLTLSLIVTLAAGAAAQDVDVHGFASQGYLRSSSNNFLANTSDGSAEYQEFAFNISSQINDDLRVGVQFFARDLGPLGNNEIELDWAFGDYRWQDELGFRIGRFKMPYGLYNENADFDAARTAVLLPTGVYDMRFRDLLVAVSGLQTYGNLSPKAGWSGSLDYSAFYGTTDAEVGGSVDRTFDAEYASLPDPNTGMSTATDFQGVQLDFVAGGSLQWSTPVDGLRLGGTLAHYEADFDFGFVDPNLGALYAGLAGTSVIPLSTANTNFTVLSAEYSWGDFVFAAERSSWKANFESQVDLPAQIPANLLDPNAPDGVMVPNPIEITGSKMNREAWYVQGSYRVNDWWEVGSYYSMYYDDAENKDRSDANDYQQDITISTRFDVSYSMTVKFEAHFIEGYGQLLSDINPGLLSGGQDVDENWTMFAAKTSFVF